MIARVALAIVALGGAATFVGWIGAERAGQRAAVVAFAPPRGADRAALDSGLADTRSSRRLGPDTSAEILEALIQRRAGRQAASDRLFERATRDEPDNVRAWLLLANTTRDGATFRRASAEVRRLNPLLSARAR